MWFQRQFGETEGFALRVGLIQDPAPAPGMPATQRWSWGTLEIWAKGCCLTRWTRDDGSVASGVVWYVLPFLQWILRRGVALLNEEPWPSRVEDAGSGAEWLDLSEQPPFTPLLEEEERWFTARSDWFQRHALRAAAAGGVFPHVVLRRVGDGVEISWDNESRPATRRDVRFVEPRGSVIVPAAVVSEALIAFARDVAAAIAARAGGDHDLLLGAQGLGVGEEDWRWLMPPLIADALSRSPRHAQVVEELREAARTGRGGLVVPHTRMSYLLRSAPPTSDPELLDGLIRIGNRRPSAAAQDSILWSMRRPAPAPAKEPWKAGYEAALELREALGWGDAPTPPLGAFLQRQGIEVMEISLDANVAGATLVTAGFMPMLVRNDAAGSWIAARPAMAFAHELAHALLDAPIDSDFGVLSTPWAHWPSEARANAFGMMLLMPDAGIRAVIAGHGAVTPAAVEDLMRTFGPGPLATTWHLRNLRFVSEEARIDLLRRLLPAVS